MELVSSPLWTQVDKWLLKRPQLVFQSNLELEGQHKHSFASMTRKRGELLIQAQPEECAPASSARARAGAIPSAGRLLAPETAPGQHRLRVRPHSFRLVPSPAQPKRAVPAWARLSVLAEQEHFINQQDSTDRKWVYNINISRIKTHWCF